ncbi:hypothetical protein SAMN05216389_1433 [Oceanobacillus limi]|uniref:Uncharacterized protein n=1 Tax=Oceanobacillus limi TaxID=930131 RepID=A0A1I0HNY7_9BACI|nr:hypothetical protein [Oceanobacillus limi]SET85711.1 hypothetical protein SAMN05216389_1433 [Oceanobacillus limi]
MARKIEIPSKKDRKIKDLESENADLWFAYMENNSKDNVQDSDIADLWFEIMNGGAS